MNNEIPAIWLIVSGIFFLLGILVFIGVLFALFKFMKMAEELKPKVDHLTTQVETLLTKVDRVADKVEGITTTAKGSIDEFRGSSSGIMGTLEHLARSTAVKSDMISPILAGGLAAYKIFNTIRLARSQSKGTETEIIVKKSKRR